MQTHKRFAALCPDESDNACETATCFKTNSEGSLVRLAVLLLAPDPFN